MPHFNMLVEHLDSLRLRPALESATGQAHELRRLALRVQNRLQAEVKETLTGDLLRAAVKYGVQMRESPEPQPPEISVNPEGDRYLLTAGAFSNRYSSSSAGANEMQARSAAAAFEKALNLVREDPATAKFLTARADANLALEQVGRLSKVEESVRLEVDRSTCVMCAPLTDAGEVQAAPNVQREPRVTGMA